MAAAAMSRWVGTLCLAALWATLAPAGEEGLLDGAADDAGAPARQLTALPPVTNVDFQDLDLDSGEISGTVTWDPPSVVSLIGGYAIYLSDSAGGGTTCSACELIGEVLLGTHSFVVANDTVKGSRTHVFVHVRSLPPTLVPFPDGVGVAICDVSEDDSLYLFSAEATTLPWGVVELLFYPSPNCTGSALRGAEGRASGSHSLSYVPDNAFDSDLTTAWASDCSTCSAGSTKLGLAGVCNADTVRCVSIRQCQPPGGLNSGSFGCLAASGRVRQLTLEVKGETVQTWNQLLGVSAVPNLDHREELLVVAGRRRRASFALISELGVVNPLGRTHAFYSR